MKLIKHVFAATDLSPSSLNAVDRGFQIARTTAARYTVMSALGLDALGPLRNLLGTQADDVAGKLVDKQRNEINAVVSDPSRNQGVQTRVVVEEGVATMVVPAHVATTNADLVVVGSRGQSTLRRLLIGSTASHLLRKSRCPVLIVKTPGVGSYKKALLPVDFSPASELAIRTAREVAPEAELVLLSVFDVPFEGMLHFAGVTDDVVQRYRNEVRQKSLQQLHALAASAGLTHSQYSAYVRHGDAAHSIVEQSEREGCDLIVMGKHGTHVTEELLLGSVTRRVMSEAETDILVVVDKRMPETTFP